jgi:hypothetical protein
VESDNKLMVESAENLKNTISLSTEGFSPLNLEIKTPEEIFELSKSNKNNLYIVF